MFAIIDNSSRKFIDLFQENLQGAKRVWIASAFVKGEALRTLSSDFENILNREGNIDFLAGLDFHITDGKALRLLYQMNSEYENFAYGCYSGSPWEVEGSFHPKFYLFEKGEKLKILIGSSNLTFGGMKSNVEINAFFELSVKSSEAESALDTFIRMKTAESRIVPDLEYIQNYQIARRQVTKNLRHPRVRKTLSKVIADLKQSEKRLSRPRVTKNDLIGWKRDVFDLLPERAFSTSELYELEGELKKKHPENQNVRPKIRQVLQQLRDLGLLEHIRTGFWKPI